MELRLGFKKLSHSAFPPSRATPFAAGYDLKSPCDVVIPKRGNTLIKTDLAISLPEGCYGRIAPRSGLALNHCLDIGGGVIDKDYTGNVGIIVFNHSDKDFLVKRGVKVAQLICEKIIYPDLFEIEELEVTHRGSSGFGSTGV